MHDAEKIGGSCHMLEHHFQYRKYDKKIEQSCRARAKVGHVLPGGKKFANEDGTPNVRSFPELE